MNIFDKLKIITPFSYMWLLRQCIGEANTILDLGCEDGRLLELLSNGKKWKVTGVDIFKKNVDAAAKREIFVKAIKGDVVKVSKQLIKEKKKFDVVFCSQVIEHINRKDGEELLKLVDHLAKKRIFMGTPRGFMVQPEMFLGDNPHMVHKSGWSQEDFEQRGYKVFGIGFGPVWSESGVGRKYTKFDIFIAGILSYLFSPIVYFIPSLGAGMLCIKNIKK